MRRTRSIWQYFLFAVPALVVALGMHYITKQRAARAIAFVPSPGHTQSGSALHELQQKLKTKIHNMEADEDAPLEDLSTHGTKARAPASTPASSSVTKSGDCASIEFPAPGPDVPEISKADWHRVMDQFHDAKELLAAWLQDHQTRFPPKTYDWMRKQVTDARIQRPAVPPVIDEEPDLSWRGIGVYEGVATPIRVGSGFVKLVASDPVRARFELARLLAQSWAPCEMAKVAKATTWAKPWDGFLSCMKMAPDCSVGSVSETGWAVSSALAETVSAPGCRVPAFDSPQAARCLSQIRATGDKGVHL